MNLLHFMASFESRLKALYRRSESSPFEYELQCLYHPLSKREDFEAELSLVESFFKTGKFLPQSLESLLSKWSMTVDRARMSKAPVIKSRPMAPLKGREQDEQTLRNYATLTAKQRETIR